MVKKEDQIQALADYINQASVICYFGGAGTSTESGIPDYRSKYGVWTKMAEENKNPQYFANFQRLKEDPKTFFGKRESSTFRPKPNKGHYALANLEKSGVDIRVITQNVDGLHQQAGHRFVIELHGNHRTWRCMTCGREYKVSEIKRDSDNIPRCYVDQGVVRPNVVYFGESINRHIVDDSRKTINDSDLLIVAGTTLTTGMAKRLARSFTGGPVIVINTDKVSFNQIDPDLYIQQPLGDVLEAVTSLIKKK